MIKMTSGILGEIKEGQKLDSRLINRLVLINQGKEVDFRIDENDVMRLKDKVCVPYFLELKKKILKEGHINGLSIHLGATKMYQDLKKMFYWPSMKKDIVEFVYSCFTCHKSKVEHQKSSELIQSLSIPE